MEKSESGSPIYRYEESDQKEFEGASGEPCWNGVPRARRPRWRRPGGWR